MDPTILFTIFTATCNRAHTLSRVYDSLCAQTCRDFEWVVVDDGSTDGTAELVGGWQQRASFPIRYLRQEHLGKHFAFNKGVAAARGRLFLSVDSDDSFVPHALARFQWHWEQIPPEARDRFVGVTARCADQYGHVVGARLPRDVIDSDSNEMRYRYGLTGDKWGFQRTEVLRQFPFPEVGDTSFVPESIVWNAIAHRYKTRYVNEVLHTYWRSESENAQISNSRLSSRGGARSMALYYHSVLNEELRWFWWAPRLLLRSAAFYSRFSFDSGAGAGDQLRALSPAARLLWALSLPAGFAASLIDRARNPTLRT